MMPSAYIVLNQWPLTDNGKIDKPALPEATYGNELLHQFAESKTEKTLLEICSQLLKIDPQLISTHANFFELGGHSLLAIKLITRVKEKFSINIGVDQVYYQKNLKTFGQLLDKEMAFQFMKEQESKAIIVSEGTL